MKWLLVSIAVALALGGGGWRTRRLLSSIKRLPVDFRTGRDRSANPADHARDVTPGGEAR
jgi:hypothetical protein